MKQKNEDGYFFLFIYLPHIINTLTVKFCTFKTNEKQKNRKLILKVKVNGSRNSKGNEELVVIYNLGVERNENQEHFRFKSCTFNLLRNANICFVHSCLLSN